MGMLTLFSNLYYDMKYGKILAQSTYNIWEVRNEISLSLLKRGIVLNYNIWIIDILSLFCPYNLSDRATFWSNRLFYDVILFDGELLNFSFIYFYKTSCFFSCPFSFFSIYSFWSYALGLLKLVRCDASTLLICLGMTHL